jgi:hypothetical protein
MFQIHHSGSSLKDPARKQDATCGRSNAFSDVVTVYLLELRALNDVVSAALSRGDVAQANAEYDTIIKTVGARVNNAENKWQSQGVVYDETGWDSTLRLNSVSM